MRPAGRDGREEVAAVLTQDSLASQYIPALGLSDLPRATQAITLDPHLEFEELDDGDEDVDVTGDLQLEYRQPVPGLPVVS
jgi:hypothetical protein